MPQALGQVSADQLTHDLWVGLGVVAAAGWFWWEKRRRGVADERLWVVVGCALALGAVFARLGTWAQHVDPRENAGLVEQFLYGNRSIPSGLLGAYAGVLVGKRITGYRERTGALFAPAVALGMTVGGRAGPCWPSGTVRVSGPDPRVVSASGMPADPHPCAGEGEPRPYDALRLCIFAAIALRGGWAAITLAVFAVMGFAGWGLWVQLP